MKISELRLAPVEMTLLHPITNEELTIDGDPVKLLVVSQDSKEFHLAVYDMQAKIRSKFEETNKIPDGIEQASAIYNMVSGLVVGWNAAAEKCFADEVPDGKFTIAAAEKIISDPSLFWIAKQVDKFIVHRTRFFPKQSETPA